MRANSAAGTLTGEIGGLPTAGGGTGGTSRVIPLHPSKAVKGIPFWCIVQVWPVLERSLGDRFAAEFSRCAKTHSAPAGGAVDDGLLFRRDLQNAD